MSELYIYHPGISPAQRVLHSCCETGRIDYPDALADFVVTHNTYMIAWNRAVQTGAPDGLERFYAPEFKAVARERESAGVGRRSGTASDLEALLRRYRGSVHFGSGRSIRLCSEQEVMVTYERNIVSRSGPIVRTVAVQTWRRTEDGWRLVFELAEQALASMDGKTAA